MQLPSLWLLQCNLIRDHFCRRQSCPGFVCCYVDRTDQVCRRLFSAIIVSIPRFRAASIPFCLSPDLNFSRCSSSIDTNPVGISQNWERLIDDRCRGQATGARSEDRHIRSFLVRRSREYDKELLPTTGSREELPPKRWHASA